MRIVSGDFRNRVIAAPEGRTTRPTAERVREAVFSSLYSRVGELDGLKALDAFAGSGAMGIEALSRGAEACVFFENDPASCKVLEANLKSLGLSAPRARVHRADVLAAPGPALAHEGPFGLVMLDPPYAFPLEQVHDFLVSLAGEGCLASGAIVSYEHSSPRAPSGGEELAELLEDTGVFTSSGSRNYGKIDVDYLRYRAR